MSALYSSILGSPRPSQEMSKRPKRLFSSSFQDCSMSGMKASGMRKRP